MSRTISLSLAGAVLPAGAGTAAPPPPPPTGAGILRHAFLVVGQSNTVGQADDAGTGTFPAGTLEFGPDEIWQAPGTRLHHPRSPRKSRPDPDADHGFARSFANRYAAANPGVELYLIGAAQGATSFTAGNWNKGDPTYEAAIARANAAMTAAPAGTVLKGILWHQGESDSTSQSAIDAWPGKMVTLIADMRADIAAAGPATPFVVGGHERTSGFYQRAIDTAAQAMPNLADHVGFASPSSPRRAAMVDGVHFDSATQTQFGHRFAEALAPAAANRRARTGVPLVGPVIEAPDLTGGTATVGATGLALGPEAPDRTVMVGLVWRQSPLPSILRVSLGGVPLRRIGVNNAGGSLCCTAWYLAPMPTGTTADLVLEGTGAFNANQTKAVIVPVTGVAPYLGHVNGEAHASFNAGSAIVSMSAAPRVLAGDLVLGLAGTLGSASRTGAWSAPGGSFGAADFPMLNKMAAHLGHAVAPADAAGWPVTFTPNAPVNQPGLNVIVLRPGG